MNHPKSMQGRLSIEKWLALERSGDIHYEYHFGQVRPREGFTLSHIRISKNAVFELQNHFIASGNNCEAFQGTLKIELRKLEHYVYADALAICDLKESDVVMGAVTNPKLIVEVSSASSAGHDHGAKFRYYRKLKSVQEYLILDQTQIVAVLYRRSNHKELFVRHDFEGSEEMLTLESVELEIPLGRMYRDVKFE